MPSTNKPDLWKFIIIFVILASTLLFFRDFILIKNRGRDSNDIDLVLSFAGSNRIEFEQVINHYRDLGDNQKLIAAKYLISNCGMYYNRSNKVFNIDGERVFFDPTIYGTEKRNKVDQIRDSFALSNKTITSIDLDCRTLSADYLVRHIDKSFETWKDCPWNDKVDFDQFCKHILPYRVQYEPLSEWHEILSEKYNHLIDSLSEKTILNATITVNNALAHDIKYDRRWIKGGFGVQSIPQLIASGSGMCDDLVVYGACAMRACGIPVSIDFDIHGRMNSGHSWCVVYDETGNHWSFGPGEQNPGEHRSEIHKFPHRNPAKVFRRSFHISEDNIAIPDKKNTNIPPFFFKCENVSDVTSEYVNTFNLDLFIEDIPKDQKYLYISVYNNQRWKPVHWAKSNRNHVIFTNMGMSLVYIVGYYNSKGIVPITAPFILDYDGSTTYLTGSGEKVESFYNKKLLSHFRVFSDEDLMPIFIWFKNDWHYLNSMKTFGDSILLEGLNDNSLYCSRVSNCRPFSVKDTTITFW